MYSQPQNRVSWCCENCQGLRAGRCYFSCGNLRRFYGRNGTWVGLFSLSEWSLCRMRWLMVHVVENLDKGLVGMREWCTAECCWVKMFVGENEGGVWVKAKRQDGEELWMPQLGMWRGWLSFCSCDLRRGLSKVLLQGPGQVLCTNRLSGQVFRRVPFQ